MALQESSTLTQDQLTRRFSTPSGRGPSTCIQCITLLLDEDRNVIIVRSRNGATASIPYDQVSGFKELLKQGWTLDSRLAARRGSLGVVLLRRHTDGMDGADEVGVIGLDLEKGSVVCNAVVTQSTARRQLVHVEVLAAASSADGQVLGMSLGVLTDSSPGPVKYQNCVAFYKTTRNEQRQELRRFQSSFGSVVSDIAFSPYNWKKCAVTGVSSYGMPYIAEYDLWTGNCVRQRDLYEISDPDMDTDNLLQINYTKDGKRLVVQAMEGTGYSLDVVYTSHIYNADTFAMVRKCRPAIAKGCHKDCIPNISPFFSRSGIYMALPNYMGKYKAMEYDLYFLPVKFSLKELSKAAILENMEDVSLVDKLPLPTELKKYICPRGMEP